MLEVDNHANQCNPNNDEYWNSRGYDERPESLDGSINKNINIDENVGISFSKWSGNDGIENYIMNQTNCKPYSGAGINPRIDKKTTILKSVDDTYYYNDDLSDINNVRYTLYGHNGDQDENEIRFNEPLLNKSKTENIYLYRVKKKGNKNEYIWYGKYEIIDKNIKLHMGKNNKLRNIIILSLKKIDI
jgi:hypothetical protein